LHFHCRFRRSRFHCSGIRGWTAIQHIGGCAGAFETPAPITLDDFRNRLVRDHRDRGVVRSVPRQFERIAAVLM
jgi:hypothetical protein